MAKTSTVRTPTPPAPRTRPPKPRPPHPPPLPADGGEARGSGSDGGQVAVRAEVGRFSRDRLSIGRHRRRAIEVGEASRAVLPGNRRGVSVAEAQRLCDRWRAGDPDRRTPVVRRSVSAPSSRGITCTETRDGDAGALLRIRSALLERK